MNASPARKITPSAIGYRAPVDILVIDIGGTNLKILRSGEETRRKVKSGSHLSAEVMVESVALACEDWTWDRVSIGYPSPVVGGRPLLNPTNLGGGWVGFDFEAAFGCPVRVMNDAAMQALGSYHGGRMLFLGLGTGLGSAMIEDGQIEPLELGHMPFRKHCFEHYTGKAGLKRQGFEVWRDTVFEVVNQFVDAIDPDYVVLGGGNVKKLDDLPERCERGGNSKAFIGGFRMWEDEA
jgi:predicted NBD/HSP70 family sugar kinase